MLMLGNVPPLLLRINELVFTPQLAAVFTGITRIKTQPSKDQRGSLVEEQIFSPFLLRFIDDQQNLELLRCRDLILLHQPRRSSRLLHHVGDGAEEAPRGGLGRLGFPLRSGGSGRWCRPRRGGLGRGGGGRRGRLGLLRPLEVRHVAVWQVGDERAVRETPAQIIHGCSSDRERRSERVLGVEGASAEESPF